MRRTSFRLSLLLAIATGVIAAMSMINSAIAQATPPPGTIALLSTRCATAGITCLAVIDANGINLVNLISTYVSSLGWSPDGTQLAFTPGDDLVIAPAYGATPVNLFSGYQSGISPAWSPDGARIAFYSNGALLVVPASGGPAVNLTTPGFAASPAWSPDGTKIAFSDIGGGYICDADSYCDGEYPHGLYVVNADGSGVTQLTSGFDVQGQPKWSSDGSRIVFTCNMSGNKDICVINSNGTGFAVLTSNPLDDFSPDWSPDGTKIAYSATTDNSDFCRDDISVVTVMDLVTRTATPLGSEPRERLSLM